jgi:SagB-type dehydrogenase family enzyme
LSARAARHVTLETRAEGDIIVSFGGYSLSLGKLSAATARRAQDLRKGLTLASFETDGANADKQLKQLVRRLAGHGLLEYRLASPSGNDYVVIEPQMPDYWPRMPELRDADVLVLSRFAYLRRRGNEFVLESPRAGALFRLCDARIATALAALCEPQQIKRLRRQNDSMTLALLALLVDCNILFKLESAQDSGLRPSEGDQSLVFWDFHDLLFHTRSTDGRHANPSGGVYPYVGITPPLPAVRPAWPGERIDLRGLSEAAQSASAATNLLRARRSTRSFDDQNPITLAELARLLDSAVRVQARWSERLDLGGADDPMMDYASRPYPTGGGSWELELYLAVNQCDGLARGFYHYDAGEHALTPIVVRMPELDALLGAAAFAMGAPAAPQVLITIVARFGRVSWKYGSIAYALILKDVGVLTQTLYLVAADMGLGACAIGSVNNNVFAKMTGLPFHIEGPVGQFAIGRAAQEQAS